MIDPTLEYCNCGLTWRPKTYHKLWMLIFGTYTRKCPQCGTVLKFKLMNHVVKVDSKSVLDEKIWRNG